MYMYIIIIYTYILYTHTSALGPPTAATAGGPS